LEPKWRRNTPCSRESPARMGKSPCKCVEQAENHDKGPRGSWARNNMGNPSLHSGVHFGGRNRLGRGQRAGASGTLLSTFNQQLSTIPVKRDNQFRSAPAASQISRTLRLRWFNALFGNDRCLLASPVKLFPCLSQKIQTFLREIGSDTFANHAKFNESHAMKVTNQFHLEHK